MKTTDKAYCRELADLLYAHGVRDAVLCPGSRNAPLIVAIGRHDGIKSISVVDERSAAFIALGIASITSRPVAIVCTSGSAVLNFAPAVAEAYYRRVPLIVISADRPAEWIDQDDSQTIRQTGVLANIVKESYSVPVENGAYVQQWLANRVINDAMLMAEALPKGPVHINMHIDMPLGAVGEYSANADVRVVKTVASEKKINPQIISDLAGQVSKTQKVLIIAGFMAPDRALDKALDSLAEHDNIVIMHEAQANLHLLGRSIPKIDSTLKCLSKEESQALLPNVVITIGGSLVSRFVKDWLRDGAAAASQYQNPKIRHWHVGMQPYSVDCFMSLDLRIETTASDFMAQLADALSDKAESSDYAQAWQAAADRANDLDKEFAQSLPWSDFKAMSMIIPNIPNDWHLQLSNGTAVRYAQLYDYGQISRIDCNRGVSGIDGCTSTAIGASSAYSGTTLLVTGDMSMQYDIGALASLHFAPNLKIIVLNNQGGGIFRFIGSTSALQEREQRLCCNGQLPLRELSAVYGYEYVLVEDEQQFAESWPKFCHATSKNAIVEIVTPPEESAEVLKKYFSVGDFVTKRR